jgi:transcriptional regulator GlxA family with amidase domain
MAGIVGYTSLQSWRLTSQDVGMTVRRVLIVLFDGVQSLDVTGPLEVFAGAASLHARQHGQPAYEVITASVGGAPVTSSSRLALVPGSDLRQVRPGLVDTLVVPGGAGTAQPDPELIGWLREHGAAPRRVASVCTGAFLLAEAGLLDGRKATTHWAYADALARRFPFVSVDADPIFVRDGRIATSAGVTAGIDLALALVAEDIGHETALAVARALVVYLRRPGGQSQFSAHLQAQSAQRAPLRQVQQWISENPAADLSVSTLADRAGLSPRQFARAFAAETGVSPGKHVAAVRLEAARRMLEDSGQGVTQVARACGYGTPEAMRRAFVQSLGVPPASYRHRF